MSLLEGVKVFHGDIDSLIIDSVAEHLDCFFILTSLTGCSHDGKSLAFIPRLHSNAPGNDPVF